MSECEYIKPNVEDKMSECEYIKPNVEVFFALPCE
jgi:hypothetical protein